VVLFRLSESGLGGEMHIRIDAPTEFSGSTTPGCVSFDVDLDASPLGISVDDQGSSKVDTDITILSGTETRECADVIGAEATPETAHMRADVTDTLITGALTIEGADFTFSARIGAAPGSTGLGTGALVFGKTLKGEDLFAVLGRSSCTVKTFQEKQKDAPECAPLFDANSSFKQDFATEFTDDDVRNELAGVASFSALRTPDGKAALLPSLRYLMPVLVVMAKKGDGGDADALLAMRRLIRLVIDQDLKA
jgi:hypothetical protein